VHIVFLADAPYIHSRRWVEHFCRRGHRCSVISFRPAEIEGAEVHYVGGFEVLAKGRYLVHARRVGRLIEELRPDLVSALHLTSYGFLAALAGVHPLVTSVWGLDILETPGISPVHAWITRYSLARADEITATGLHLATAATAYTPPKASVTVVPYGVDLEVFQPAPRPAGDEVVIGAAARLSKEKGVGYLIEAFALLRQHGLPLKLRLAGDGPEREKLGVLVHSLGVANNVAFLGEIDHTEVPGFLQDLDIFVLPSVFEGFGVAAIEASAVGLPVVASDVFGIPDAVTHGETGLLVPPRDARKLADAIETLARDPDRRKAYGEAGRAMVRERYDWQKNVRQMELVFARALDRAGGKPGAAS
jgi:glycosyltransferase involved in cell wall biosynthesis